MNKLIATTFIRDKLYIHYDIFVSGLKEQRQTLDIRRRTIHHLDAGTTYKATLRVKTDAGESEFSHGVIFRTVSLTSETVDELRDRLGIINAEAEIRGKISKRKQIFHQLQN